MKTIRKLQKIPGFTLIELLVVIAVIAMLMAILMPSLQKAREQSRQVVCGANLHAVGQAFVIYAHDHDDRLVPGNHSIPWLVWGDVPACAAGFQEVNLGHLLKTEVLPIPRNDDNVLFCPSMKSNPAFQASGVDYFDYETFRSNWHKLGDTAPVDYMYNTALDGFGNSVHTGTWAILSHQNRVQYLMPDGSVHTFKVVPLVYDAAAGPELLQEVTQRYGINFPALLLHQWFAEGQVDLDEAKAYLANPAGWMNAHANSLLEEAAIPTRLTQVANASLVSDVVGAWDAPDRAIPQVPG